jgi:hypothetical protein
MKSILGNSFTINLILFIERETAGQLLKPAGETLIPTELNWLGAGKRHFLS